MRKPFLITTPFPTLDETARILGISRTRREWLEALADEIQKNGRADSPQPSAATPAKNRRSVSKRSRASARKK